MTQGSPQKPVPSAPTVGVDEVLLQAKLEAVEARTETKFAQLLGKIELLTQGIGTIKDGIVDIKAELVRLDTKVESVDGHARVGKREIITAIITTGLAVAALAWAGVQIFQGGLSLNLAKEGIENANPKTGNQPR